MFHQCNQWMNFDGEWKRLPEQDICSIARTRLAAPPLTRKRLGRVPIN
jgi:hypothetical protein